MKLGETHAESVPRVNEAGRQREGAGSVARMSIETYVAILHDGEAASAGGESVLCPLQPNGQPKPIIDHDGVLYDLLDGQNQAGVFDYKRVSS